MTNKNEGCVGIEYVELYAEEKKKRKGEVIVSFYGKSQSGGPSAATTTHQQLFCAKFGNNSVSHPSCVAPRRSVHDHWPLVDWHVMDHRRSIVQGCPVEI